jgi:peptidoglycan-associated lipoprotein
MPLADVIFDYDMSTVREDQRALLQKNADWMRRWTTTRVTIEGHADARGTNEYNLALGERRGNAVKDYMVSLGITADRLTVISKGEEAQVCSEMTDACYARNRRAHFIITAK